VVFAHFAAVVFETKFYVSVHSGSPQVRALSDPGWVKSLITEIVEVFLK